MAVMNEFPLVILVLILTSLTQIRSEACTFTRSADTMAPIGGQYVGSMSLEDCEQECVADDLCVTISHFQNSCFNASDTQTIPSPGTTFSLKSCTPDTTPEPTTPEPTTPEPTTQEPTTPKPTTPEPTTPEPTTPEPTTQEPTTLQPTTPEPTTLQPTTLEPTTLQLTTLEPTTPNTQQGVCVMTRTEDTTGGNDVYYKLDFSFTSCLGLCQVVDDCQSVTIGRTSCQYYTDVTTPTTILGSIHYVKTQCNDGIKCCWETQTHSASKDTPSFVHDNTLDSCEALCGKLVACSGVKWSNNECHVYVNHPDLTPESNSTFSKKACSTGGDIGSFRLSSTCSERNGGIQLKTNFILLAICVIDVVLKHILC